MKFLNRLSHSQRQQLQQTLQQFPDEVWECDMTTLNIYVPERPLHSHARSEAAQRIEPAILTLTTKSGVTSLTLVLGDTRESERSNP